MTPSRRSRGGTSEPLRILDITKFYAPSGGGVKTYLSAKGRWASTREDVDHVVVLPGPDDRREEDPDTGTRIYRIRGPRIPMSPAYRFLLSTRKVRAVIEAERPDVIEVGSPFLVPWITRRAARGTDAALLGFYHCDLVGAYTARLMPRRPRTLRKAALHLTRRYVAAVYNRFATTIAATPTTAHRLQECGVERIAIVPLAVDADVFHPDRRDPGWRDELRVRPGAPLLLYAGRLCREKEVDVVMRAVPELHARYGATVVFVGEGHLRPGIQALAREMPDAVRDLDYQTEPRSLARCLASADVCLAPFSYETFGLSALEAMACGRPVVGSRSLALIDLLSDERAGRTFAPGDAADLVRAVGEVLEAGPDALGRQARQRAAAYTWRRTFDALFEVYRKLRPESPTRPRSTPARPRTDAAYAEVES